MKSPRRQLLTLFGGICLVLALHSALLLWLSNREVVAKLLAAGAHVPVSTLALAVIFVLVRLFTFVVLPGVVCIRLAALALQVWGPKVPPPVSHSPVPEPSTQG